MSLTERDILRLQGVDADLVRVVKHADRTDANG